MMRTNYLKFIAVMMPILMLLTLFPNISVDAAYENTHINTGNQAEDIAAVAETQVGYKEGANNETKYNHWLGKISGYPANGYGYAWCQCFVAWCANQANIGTDKIPKIAGTVSGMDFFRKNGTWHNGPGSGGSYIPKRGDIIYFFSSGSNSGYHVGIVTDCKENTVYTVEGNSSDMVAKRSYSISNSKIYGYGVPNYPNPKPGTILSVKTGSSTTKTTFSWNNMDGATGYDVKIWKGALWVGDPYYIEWGASSSFSTVLPSGTYNAYVDTRYGSEIVMSNVVEFVVTDGCELRINIGNSSTNTTFYWNNVNGATEYDVKIWKNKLWEGNPYYIEWGASNPFSIVLPAGKYCAYVDSRIGDKIVMSNDIEFTVLNGCKLKVDVGNSSSETKFSWNTVAGASEYDVKVWKDELWKNDPCLLVWGASNPCSAVLPDGKYFAYVDTRYDNDIVMSNVVEFDVSKGCKLNVKPGNTSTETEFTWNNIDGATEYDVKVWKDELWKGDPCVLEWGASNPYSTVLPEGKYFAYVDAIIGKDIYISNVVEFSVSKSESIKGDANNDGEVTIADLVMLQKWLLGSSTELTCWQNVDLCEDGVIDVFDMVMLRRLIISKK